MKLKKERQQIKDLNDMDKPLDDDDDDELSGSEKDKSDQG
jgi:hypothetical protein